MIDIGYAGAFLGGVLTLLSPCSAVLLPAFFAYAFSSPAALVGRTVVFYAGLVTMLVPLGLAASSLGSLLTERRGILVGVVSAVVIVLGALQMLGVSLRLPGRTSSPRRDPANVFSVYLLGTAYGVAGVCSGPILGSVLAVAALGTDAIYGGMLLAVYALGMVVPLVILAMLWERLELSRRRWLRPKPVTVGPVHTTSTGLVSGALFVCIGVLLLITAGTANLGGVLSIDQQYAAESAIVRWSQDVSNVQAVAVLLGLAVALLGFGWLMRRRRTRSDSRLPDQPGSDLAPVKRSRS